MVASTTVHTDGTCSTEPEPGIDVEKSCPSEVSAGEAIEYTITVENTGDEPLVDVTVNDSLLGDITADFDLPDPLPVATPSTRRRSSTRRSLADPDPLTNRLRHRAPARTPRRRTRTRMSARPTSRTYRIDVTKSCPRVSAGEAIKYTITVENTGDERRSSVTVNDSLLGDITADFDLPDPLPVGDTVTRRTFFYTPAADDDPLTNTVTASGFGEDSEPRIRTRRHAHRSRTRTSTS